MRQRRRRRGWQTTGFILLFPEEVRVLKLADYDGLSQEEVASQLGVSQPTVHRILKNARKKLVVALIEGKEIVIGERLSLFRETIGD